MRLIFIFWIICCQTLTDYNDLWCVKSQENLTSKYLVNFFQLTCQLQPIYLGKSKKSFSTIQLLRTSDYLCYFGIKRTVTLLLYSLTVYLLRSPDFPTDGDSKVVRRSHHPPWPKCVKKKRAQQLTVADQLSHLERLQLLLDKFSKHETGLRYVQRGSPDELTN